jgi:hypothetical protein
MYNILILYKLKCFRLKNDPDQLNDRDPTIEYSVSRLKSIHSVLLSVRNHKFSRCGCRAFL